MPSGNLTTDRLVLRRWREADKQPFAAMNADPRVMEFMPSCLTRAESDAFVAAIKRGFERDGFGLWAVEVRRTTEFAGYVGLARPGFEADFMPCVEIGWRLARAYWGYGYATEAARAAIRYAFEDGGLVDLVSFTYRGNTPSRRLMERLGMRHCPDEDFDHPKLPGHALERHVLYRLSRDDWPG